jgi:hypothetical protein
MFWSIDKPIKEWIVDPPINKATLVVHLWWKLKNLICHVNIF